MEFRIQIRDEIAPRIIQSASAQHGYQPVLEDGSANPQTRQQFIRERIIAWLKESAKAYEANQAAESARNTVLNEEIVF